MVLLAARMSKPLNFLAAFQPGPGHLSRIGAVAGTLASRGHCVTLASAASSRRLLEHVPHQHFLPIGPDWSEDRVALPPSGNGWQDLRDRSQLIVEAFFQSASQVASDLEAACEKQGAPDCYLFDYTLFGGPLAAERLGVPWIAMFGLTLPFKIDGWPPFGSYGGPAPSRSGSLVNSLMSRYVEWENRATYAPLRRLWRGMGRSIRNPWDPCLRWAKAGIVGSILDCEFPLSPPMRSRFHYVGPIFDADEEAAASPDLEGFLAQRTGPLIHVTLGLTFSRAAAVLDTILEGLAPTTFSVVVATGHLGGPHAGDAKTLFAPVVPHVRLFPQLDAVVCHGGANTLMKSLHFGVPALVIPLGAEQRSNAARFVHAGIARTILPDRLNGETVRQELLALLDPRLGYRERARELAKTARDNGGAAAAADIIERLCLPSHE